MPDPVTIDQTYELVDPSTLIEHPANPRRSDDALIEKMIRAHGFYGALTVQTSTRHVLAGNGRLRAARRLGMQQVPVTWRDVDDATALEILAGDNRASDLGVYDQTALATMLSTLQQRDVGLVGTGYDDTDLAMLLQSLDGAGYGTGSFGPTPSERRAQFDATELRTVVLPYPGDQYATVVAALGKLKFHLDAESFSDVVALVVEQAAADIETEP